MDTTTDFDLNELLAGTVESVIEKLDQLSDNQLGALLDLEKQGGARPTLLNAIEAEQAERADHDAAEEAANAKKYSQAEVDDMIAKREDEHNAATSAMFTRAQVDEMLATQKAQADADTKQAIAKATGDRPARTKAPKSPERIVIAKNAPAVALVALTGQSSVVFADQDDMPIGMPAMVFGASDFRPNGDRVVLMREVEFPSELPATEVLSAFIAGEDGKPIAKASLVQPFGVGGGRRASLPAGHLTFG